MQHKSSTNHHLRPGFPSPNRTGCDPQLALSPLSALRAPFCHWIRSLPMEERFLALKIELPDAVRTVRLACSRAQHLPQQRSMDERPQGLLDCKRFSRKYEKLFYDSLVFLSDGNDFLDHVCFDYALIECPEKLYDMLMGANDAGSGQLLIDAARGAKEGKSLNQILQKLASREQISYAFFTHLRQQVFANFSEYAKNSEALGRGLEEEKKRKKEFSNSWKFMPQEIRGKLLLLGHTDTASLLLWLNEHEVNIKQHQLEKQIEQLLKLEKKEFCNRVFKCKAKKILTPAINYYELLYLHWKKEVDRSRKKRTAKHNRAERDYSSQQKTEPKQQHSRKYKKNRKSNSVESNETNETEHPSKKPANSSETHEELQQPIKVEGQRTTQKQYCGQAKEQFNPVSEIYSSPKKSVSASSTSTKISSKHSQQAQKQGLLKQSIRATAISRLNDQLQQISDKISEQANEFHDRRVIAFQRIQFLLQYYNIPIKLFGSCASGIAVRNSDIDITVDNSILMYMDFLPQHEKIKAALQKLEELFLTQAWITEIKFIKTAAIPLIKLTINTELPFFDPSIGEMYYQLNRIHNCGPINADITIQTKNKSEECSHLGLISTNAINKWLEEISSLHSIIIILKEFFARKKLNCTYEGGLNTFSMIVLMVAYIFHAKLEKEDNAAEVFQRILRFYSQQFDERQRGIDLLNKDSNTIFYIKNLVNVEGTSPKKQKADLQIKDPMNQQKNMTRNCYSFPEIKLLFKQMVEQCFERGSRELQEAVKERKEARENLEVLNQISREAFSKRNVFIEFLSSVEPAF